MSENGFSENGFRDDPKESSGLKKDTNNNNNNNHLGMSEGDYDKSMNSPPRRTTSTVMPNVQTTDRTLSYTRNDARQNRTARQLFSNNNDEANKDSRGHRLGL